MRKGGRSVVRVMAVLAVGVLVAGGCSKLQTSLDKRDTPTLGDLAARVANLEQTVADLQAANGNQPASEPVDASGMARDAGVTARETADAGGRAATQKLAKGTRAVVTATSLNVRKEPSASAAKLTTLPEGATVQVMALEGEWAKVKVADRGKEITGWVASRFLERQDQ